MKHTKIIMLAAATMLIFGACKQKAEVTGEAPEDTTVEVSAPAGDVYQFTVKDCENNTVALNDYKGKILLVVNSATQCGFTPQYFDLQRIYSKYHARGLEILDFPCNQFGEQAPGTNKEIHDYCTGKFNIVFPQMAKVDVNGEKADALFVWLKSQAPFGGFDTSNPIGAQLDKAFRAQDSLYDKTSDIKWNFTKFLIGRDGKVAKRFEPTASFDEIEKAIESLL